MKQQFTALCTVHRDEAGKVSLKLFDRRGFDRGLERFGDGQDLELHIEEIGRKRTHAQNRFFHGPILNAFAEPYGDSARAKTELCLRFIPIEHQRPDGSIVIVPGHTSDLTVQEFNGLIENCLLLAAENGIDIQSSEEWRETHRSKEWTNAQVTATQKIQASGDADARLDGHPR